MPRYRFGDIVKEVKENIDRANNPYACYVAGEHMDTDTLEIRRRGTFENSDVGPAFIRVFHPGQILYGSRRTYLKKVAVADFSGITSNTTFVLEAKDEQLFLHRLLPFLMLSDRFTEFSIKNSKGSTNPYILFSDLAQFEVDVPEIEEQRQLADLLWAYNEAKNAYLGLMTSTDALVKSQFIEMFGDPIRNSKSLRTAKLGTLGRWASGGTPSRNKPDYYEGSIEWFSAGELNSMYLVESIERITEEAVAESAAKVFPSGSMLIGMYDTAALKMGILTKPAASNQACANIIPNHDVNIVWLYWAIEIMKPYLLGMRRGVRQKNLNQQMIKEFCVPFPSFDLQNRFAAFVETTDKSEFATAVCRNETIAASPVSSITI